MGKAETIELQRRKLEQCRKLTEIMEVTRQIADAAGRNDEVAMQMLLAERERPVRELYELHEGIEGYLPELPEETAIRLSELLHGAEPETAEEKALVEQASRFRRQLEKLVDMDEQLSVRMGGKRSFYKIFR